MQSGDIEMKELLQQALDALLPHSSSHGNSWRSVEDAAIKAIEQALAQQEQPASVDAYVGAREDAAIWKKRALEAEELNRKFIAEVNGPTYLGEPVKQEQPAQKVSESWTDIVAVNLVREGVNKHKARELAAHFLTLFAPPTQPALSESQITSIAYNCNALPEVITDKTLVDFVRAIEAHCRGGLA